MADRPIFIPVINGPCLVRAVSIHFSWAPGMALSQARKRIEALHTAAVKLPGLQSLLEVSSKSPNGLGVALSAFNLHLVLKSGVKTTVESAYHAGKRFGGGGPFKDLLSASSSTARSDPRLRSSGPLIGFADESGDWPLSPPTAYYDWLYLTALGQSPHLARQLGGFDAFSDIAFNPSKSLSCQARSAALYVALERRGELAAAMASKAAFIATCDGRVADKELDGLF